MASPDVLKRLEEIEAWLNDPVVASVLGIDLRWLLRLTRALLESQGELLVCLNSLVPDSCDEDDPCYFDCGLGPGKHEHLCEEIKASIARAERVRRGDL